MHEGAFRLDLFKTDMLEIMKICYSHTALSVMCLPLTILLLSVRYFTLYLYNNVCICASAYIYIIYVYTHTYTCENVYMSIYRGYKYIQVYSG